MPKLAKTIDVKRRGREVTLAIDGEEFAWYLAAESITTTIEPEGRRQRPRAHRYRDLPEPPATPAPRRPRAVVQRLPPHRGRARATLPVSEACR